MFYEVDIDHEIELMRKEEREEGRKEGRKEGRDEERIAGAAKFIDNLISREGMSLARACELAELSSEEYLAYKAELDTN